MLRFSRRSTTKSAHEELAGKFDWNKTPLAPIGTKSLIFDDPRAQRSWAPHGTDCYYVGPAMAHYRCLKFWCPSSRRVRTGDTFRLYPKHCTTPSISEHDLTLLAARDIVQCWDVTIKPDTRHKLDHALVIQCMRDLLQHISPTPTSNSGTYSAPYQTQYIFEGDAHNTTHQRTSEGGHANCSDSHGTSDGASTFNPINHPQ